MKNILQINSSILSSNSQSTRLASELVAALADDGATVVVRDLAANPIPHLDGERFGAFLAPQDKRTEIQNQVVSFSDALIAEIRNADTLVIGLPMYNFGVPSQLKAWFDHIARAGVTFKYTDKGAVGLLTGKKVYVIATRGGLYAGTPADSQTAYVRAFLAFLGMSDVEFVYAEGLAISEASKAASLEQARTAIDQLAPAYA
jgi:FMN-dependent NADH-azoreductase